jgi:hypothetical protein
MFVKAAFFLSLGSVLAVSCATKQFDEGQFGETIAGFTGSPGSASRSYTVLEHENPAGDLPQWLQRYLDSGERLVEEAADYSGDYVFVAIEKGSGLAALEKWSEYFRVEQDFSQTVFLRVYNRLIAESGGLPDYYLGGFFEVFLKKIAGHTFEGARRADDYWIRVSFESGLGGVPAGADDPEAAAADTASETIEEYRYYILSRINKASFEREIMDVFSAAQAEVTLTNAQADAVSRLQGALFSGF